MFFTRLSLRFHGFHRRTHHRVKLKRVDNASSVYLFNVYRVPVFASYFRRLRRTIELVRRHPRTFLVVSTKGHFAVTFR